MAKIKFPDENVPEDLKGLISLVFWKNPKLIAPAVEFVKHVKDWERSEKPYSVDEWQRYCTRNNITQSTYHNILKRLKDVGMIEKTYNRNRKAHELRISTRFSDTLNSVGLVWSRYKST